MTHTSYSIDAIIRTEHGTLACPLSILLFTTAALVTFSASFADSPAYDVTYIPVPDGAISITPTAINASGHIVGSASYSQNPVLRAWSWSPDGGTILLPQPPSASLYRATDINDMGVILGDGGFDGGVAWRYEDGEFTSLGTMPNFPISNAEGINNAKEVAGTAKDFSFLTPDRAYFHSDPAGMINITPDFGARGTDINEQGQTSGYSQSNNAFRWSSENGIEFLSPPDSLPYTFAFAINDHGDLVGEAKSLNGNIARAFIYTDATGMQTLPHLAGQLNQAWGINNHNEVVGFSDPPGSLVAWHWSADEGLRTLNDLIDPDENLNLLQAWDINDAGQIIASGVDTVNGGQQVVVLTPADDAVTGDLNGDGVVDVDDLFILLAAWGECADCADCEADLNDDCGVDAEDLFILLANWG